MRRSPKSKAASGRPYNATGKPTVWRFTSGFDAHGSELKKVLIKSQRSRTFEPSDNDFARAVRKTPVLVAKTQKNLPSRSNFLRNQLVNDRQSTSKEPGSQSNRALGFSSSPKKSERFVNNIIRRNRRVLVISEPLRGFQMVRIPGNNCCEPRSRIDEYLLSHDQSSRHRGPGHDHGSSRDLLRLLPAWKRSRQEVRRHSRAQWFPQWLLQFARFAPRPDPTVRADATRRSRK